MATTVISKSSLNVVGGGQFSSSTPGSGGIGFSTTSTQYALVTATAVTAGDSLTIGSASFPLPVANTPYSFYVGPSTTIGRAQSATNFSASIVILGNT